MVATMTCNDKVTHESCVSFGQAKASGGIEEVRK